MYLLSSSNNATLEKKIKSIVLFHESRKTYFAKYLLAYLDHYIVSSYLFLQFYVIKITKDTFSNILRNFTADDAHILFCL